MTPSQRRSIIRAARSFRRALAGRQGPPQSSGAAALLASSLAGAGLAAHEPFECGSFIAWWERTPGQSTLVFLSRSAVHGPASEHGLRWVGPADSWEIPSLTEPDGMH